jgi:hypothetical protein
MIYPSQRSGFGMTLGTQGTEWERNSMIGALGRLIQSLDGRSSGRAHLSTRFSAPRS